MTFKERYQYDPQKDLIGKGGFARVYKATDCMLNRTVALKFFTSQSGDKHNLVREISQAIQLEHPNLCRYFDIAVVENINVHGESENIEVGVMEYLDGGDIKTYLQENPAQLDKLLTDVLQGLSFLHENGIIHRDLKAQNILVKNTSKGPVAKITDFGISKATSDENSTSSALLGTIEYMSPEQFNPGKYGINGRVSTNMDFWSFGLLVYELIQKEKFFGGNRNEEGTAQVMNRILEEESPAKLEYLPEPYQTIIKKCLVKNAENRVGQASELLVLLTSKEQISEAHTGITKAIPSIMKAGSIPKLHDSERDLALKKETAPPRRKNALIFTVLLISFLLVIASVFFFTRSKFSDENDDTANKDEINKQQEDSLDKAAVVFPTKPDTTRQFKDGGNLPVSDKTSDNKERKVLAKKEPITVQQKKCTNCNGSGTVSSYLSCITCSGQGSLKCSFSKYQRSVCSNGSLSCTKCQGSGSCINCTGSGQCKKCSGSGTYGGYSEPLRCIPCSGSGDCSRCKGSGHCNSCKGEGNETCSNCGGKGTVSCITCNSTGKGESKASTCNNCKGNGYI